MNEISLPKKQIDIDFTRFTSSLGLFISNNSSDLVQCFFSGYKKTSKPEYSKNKVYSIYEITPLVNTLAITNNIIDLNIDSRLTENEVSISMAIVLDWQPQLKKFVTITIDDVHMLLDEELNYIKTKKFKEDITKFYHRMLYTRGTNE